jgi:uncharacterized protein with PIN domain
MLERLARWLRVLGYDVLSAGPAGAAAALDHSAATGRIVLTRNRAIAAPGPAGGAFLLHYDAPLDQLVEVLSELGLRPPRRLFTRCLVCNQVLAPVAPPDVPRPGGEPEPLHQRCSNCGRVYWEGVHTGRMRAALQRVLGPSLSQPG